MIKTLRRKPNITPLSEERYQGWAWDKYRLGKPPTLMTRIKRSVMHGLAEIPILNLGRKKWANWPEPEPSILQKVQDYLSPMLPSNVNMDTIKNLISKAGSNLPIIIGITAIAGLIYLTYKVYEAHQSGDLARIKNTISEAYNEIMADLKKRAGDLLGIPGWLSSVGNQVKEALESGDPSTMLSKLTDVVHSVVSQQKTIGPVKGSGLLRNLYRKHAVVKRYHKGSGAMVPIF